MYCIRFEHAVTEEPIFIYNAYAPPFVSDGDLIRIAEMTPPAFPDGIYIITDVFYDFERNSKGEDMVFVHILVLPHKED